jgi:PIN domain nuclease of toxin-antitoxin system
LNLLLDTHIALWWFDNNPRLTKRVRQAIRGADKVFVSVASAWEYAIKAALGRLKLPEPFEVALSKSGFEPLGIAFIHAEHLVRLPLHHGDPFDRMLIAQAEIEGLTLVSDDRWFDAYGISLLRA